MGGLEHMIILNVKLLLIPRLTIVQKNSKLSSSNEATDNETKDNGLNDWKDFVNQEVPKRI